MKESDNAITVKSTVAGYQEAIRWLAERSGVSLAQLAHLAGKHPSSLYLILDLKEDDPREVRRSTLVALAQAAGCDVRFYPGEDKITFSRTVLSAREQKASRTRFEREILGIIMAAEASGRITRRQERIVKEILQLTLALCVQDGETDES